MLWNGCHLTKRFKNLLLIVKLIGAHFHCCQIVSVFYRVCVLSHSRNAFIHLFIFVKFRWNKLVMIRVGWVLRVVIVVVSLCFFCFVGEIGMNVTKEVETENIINRIQREKTVEGDSIDFSLLLWFFSTWARCHAGCQHSTYTRLDKHCIGETEWKKYFPCTTIHTYLVW